MIVHTEYSDIPLPGSPMRTFVAAPKAEGKYPGIWCYSDIFQLTPPLLRFCVRLAGYGFVAAAPEIYRRIEPPGTVIPFDDAGRTRGQQDAAKTPVAHFDEDCRSGLDWLSKHPKVAQRKNRRDRFLHRRPPRFPCRVPTRRARNSLLLRHRHPRRQARSRRRCRIAGPCKRNTRRTLNDLRNKRPPCSRRGTRNDRSGRCETPAFATTLCFTQPNMPSRATKDRASIRKQRIWHSQR